MPGYREIVVSQGAQGFTSWIASRIRAPKQVKLDDLPEPDRPALHAAEQLVATGAPAEGESVAEFINGPLMFPDGLFDAIEDREEGKLVLERAIRSPKPVHVLLVGDPASGKSQLLMACMTLPHSRYAVGGATSSSGLIEYLLEKPNTQILLIDELDKADMRDLHLLYGLMESGMVTRLQHNATEQHIRRVRVFAAANRIDKLPEALRSRFVIVTLAAYSDAQLLAINRRIVAGEGLGAARASTIATEAARRSRDPRDARDVARLAGEDGDLEAIMDQVIPPPKRRKSR
jgi:hypothetical protein